MARITQGLLDILRRHSETIRGDVFVIERASERPGYVIVRIDFEGHSSYIEARNPYAPLIPSALPILLRKASGGEWEVYIPYGKTIGTVDVQPTSNAPSLGGQHKDNSPMLGGDRRIETAHIPKCTKCGILYRCNDDGTVTAKCTCQAGIIYEIDSSAL